MPHRPLAIIPLKGFDLAKGRLDLSPENRSSLTQAVAEHVITACRDGGLTPLVVTGSEGMRVWAAAFGAEVLVETPGKGLDAAAAYGAAQAGGGPWLVVHGDLPLLSAEDIAHVGHLLAQGGVVLAPSRDGGTNLLGANGHFDFRYGPASFHRHLAVAAGREVKVVIRPGTALEIDTLSDLHSIARLPSGEWLRRFLS
ncbi:MAG: 2-phospho-L-lactate guanylyltransferase [Acidimicrobiia bacterium]